jgi:hypothetical protein
MSATVSKIAPAYVDQWEDGDMIKACAEWHVYRAQYLLTVANHHLGVLTASTFKGDCVQDDEDDSVNQLRDIESWMETATPKTAKGAAEIMNVAMTMMTNRVFWGGPSGSGGFALVHSNDPGSLPLKLMENAMKAMNMIASEDHAEKIRAERLRSV